MVGRLTKSYPLEAKAMRDSATSFVRSSVAYGTDYTFWKYDSKHNEMTFVQTYKEHRSIRRHNNRVKTMR
ncbi:two-component system regulatory protein YycI [Exiguobacterium antarcticum]|uniref:two-component system regulatory protein YycI n=1 Tax=Exiguobacterium antarcticum TaxID=132920 RepID=UPI000A8F55FF|nr:two-component system regulatory protein YycI [Exiguobacterium antarcticum]